MSSAILRGVGHRIPQGKMGRHKFNGNSPTVLRTLSVDRNKVSNISNTDLPLYLSRGRNYHNWQSTHSANKENVEYLHEDAWEIDWLRKLLAERDATIESQSLEIAKCKEIIESQSREKQKVWDDWNKASEQNRKLVQTIGKMFGELCKMRENLRLLEHNYNLMDSLHKANRQEHGKMAQQSQQCQCAHQIGSKVKMAKSPQQSWQCQGIYQTGRMEKMTEFAHQCRGMPQTGSKEKMAELPRQSQHCQGMNQTGSKKKMANLSQQSQQLQGIHHTGSKELGQSQDTRQVWMEASRFSQRNICSELGSSPRMTGSANVQDTNNKRSCLRRRSANVCYKEPDLEPEPRRGKHAVSAQRLGQRVWPSIRGKETLEKIPEDQAHHVTFPPSELVRASCHISSLQTGPKGTPQFRRPLTGRPMRRAATIVASYKEQPLNTKMRRSH